MTTLIMVQTRDDVLLGWDSRMTRDNEVSSLAQPKFVINNGIIYGITGTFRASDIFEMGDFPEYDPEKYPNPRKWIIKEWVPVARELLLDEPGLTKDDGVIDGWGLFMVVAGKAYQFDQLLNAVSTVDGVYTAGSGGDYARGAMYAGATVMDALHVAGNLDPYTGGAYTVAYASKYLLTADEPSKSKHVSEPSDGRLEPQPLW